LLFVLASVAAAAAAVVVVVVAAAATDAGVVVVAITAVSAAVVDISAVTVSFAVAIVTAVSPLLTSTPPPLPLLPAYGAATASTAAVITTIGISTAVDAASGLIVVFPATASVFDAMADSSSLAVHAYEKAL